MPHLNQNVPRETLSSKVFVRETQNHLFIRHRASSTSKYLSLIKKEEKVFGWIFQTTHSKKKGRRAWKLTVGSDKKEACAAKYAIILSLNGTVLNEGSFFVKNEYFSHRMKEMDSIFESSSSPPLLRLEFRRTHHLCFDFSWGFKRFRVQQARVRYLIGREIGRFV